MVMCDRHEFLGPAFETRNPLRQKTPDTRPSGKADEPVEHGLVLSA